MTEIKSYEKHGLKIEIHTDEDPQSPRGWDNLGTMVCFHPHYTLGDEHGVSVEELKRRVKRRDIISLPLYLYDHSGLWMSTSRDRWPFNCPWDSMQVGYVVISRARVRSDYKVRRISPQLLRRVLATLRTEVVTYSQYLQGEVYGFVVSKGNEDVDSCWGFYGLEYAESQADEAAQAAAGGLNHE